MITLRRVCLPVRQAKVLAEIILKHIKTAEPVSSGLLAQSRIFKVSSATIRNEMNDLEELGYLVQLHTSGGRVPTDRAYRFYVDNILVDVDLDVSDNAKRKIRLAIERGGNDPREINKIIAKTLSGLSNNLIFANILKSDDCFKTGLSSLMEFPEFREFDRMFQLTSFFDRFETMFDRIEKEFFGEQDSEVNVFIGRENPMEGIKDEAVITAKYSLPRRHIGSLTLVGPMRMDYEKNIGLVKYAVGEMNKIFST